MMNWKVHGDIISRELILFLILEYVNYVIQMPEKYYHQAVSNAIVAPLHKGFN